MDSFEKYLTPGEMSVIQSLDTPYRLQQFLDTVPYTGGVENRSPVDVLRRRQAHCLDGGLFAVSVLTRLGHPPLIIDLLPYPGTDDDHVLAIFKQNGHWGCVAKSNFTGLRFREPVYRTFRELVLSYFNDFFNMHREKTMWGYSGPFNLTRYFHMDWIGNHAMVDKLEKDLKKKRGRKLISEEMASSFNLLDELSYRAGTLATNFDGVYKLISDSGK